MSLKRIKPLPSPTGVPSGAVPAGGVTAMFDLPVGPRYGTIWTEIGSSAKLAASEIVSRLRLKLNGKVQREMTAAELDAINTMYGQNGEYAADIETDGAGAGTGHIVKTRLPIYLAEPWRKQLAVADGLAWGTGDVSSFQLELDLVAAVDTVTLAGYAEVDYATVKDDKGVDVQPKIGAICKWFRQQVPVNGTSQEITQFPKRDFYQQISFFDSHITDFIVETDSIVQRNLSKKRNDSILVSREMVPVAERLDVVFDYEDIITGGLPMIMNGLPVKDFQVKLTLDDGTARNITTILQRLGPPE